MMNSDRVIIATEYINTCFAKLTKKEKKKKCFQTFFWGLTIWRFELIILKLLTGTLGPTLTKLFLLKFPFLFRTL